MRIQKVLYVTINVPADWKLLGFFFASDELTRLWNLNQDNMEACKSDSRSVD